MEEKTLKSLNDSIKDLIKVIKSSSPSSSVASSRLSSESNQTSNDSIMSKVLEDKLKSMDEYNKIMSSITKKEEKLLKLAQKDIKLESSKLEYVKKMKEIEDLRIADTSKMTVKQKKTHENLIKASQKELKELSNQYELQKKITKEQERLNKLKEDTEKQSKSLIEDEIKKNKIKEKQAEKRKTLDDISKKSLQSIDSINASIFSWAKKTFMKVLEQDSAAQKLAANYALSRKESHALKANLLDASLSTRMIGVDVIELAKAQSSYTDELGRSVLLSRDGLVAVSNMGIATGIGAENAAKMAAEMEQFGYSAESSSSLVENLMKNSKKWGVSSSVSTKRMQENLKIANSYTFKDGLKGVSSMTVYSEKFKMNMASIAGFADKISNPEGAIQASANLQVLGGSFAQMSDPMRLLDQGINDLEGLGKTYTKMLSGIAKINKETGEVTINGYDRLRMKAASEAMGINFDEMMTNARIIAKRNAIESTIAMTPMLKGADENTKNLIASIGQFGSLNGKKGFTVNVGGKTKLLTQLSKEDLDLIQPKDNVENLRTVAENTLGLKETFLNGLDMMTQKLINVFFPAIDKLSNFLIGTFNKIQNLITGNGSGIKGGLASSMGMGGKFLGKTFGGSAIRSGIKGGKNALAFGSGLIGKEAAVSGGKLLGKYGLKSIPVLGSIADLYFAYKDLQEGDTTGALLNALSAGAGFIPGIGTAASLGIDAYNMYREVNGGIKSQPDKVNDVLIPSRGKPVRLDSKDDVFAVKPGGAFSSAIKPALDAKSMYSGVEKGTSGVYTGRNSKLDLNIQGTLTLALGNHMTKVTATELIKDPQFLRELSRIIGKQINIDRNGGKYMGGLNANSF